MVQIIENARAGWWRNGSAGPWTPIPTICGLWYGAKKRTKRPTASAALQAYELEVFGGIWLRDSETFDKLIDSWGQILPSNIQLAVGYDIQGGNGRYKVKIFKYVIFGAGETELSAWPEPAKMEGEWRPPIRLSFMLSKKPELLMSNYVATYDDDEWQNH